MGLFGFAAKAVVGAGKLIYDTNRYYEEYKSLNDILLFNEWEKQKGSFAKSAAIEGLLKERGYEQNYSGYKGFAAWRKIPDPNATNSL